MSNSFPNFLVIENLNIFKFLEMAELTPEFSDVVSNKMGLRRLADMVNFDITKLYASDFGYAANIVAVDFYRATNIVDLAIDWNNRKLKINHSRRRR